MSTEHDHWPAHWPDPPEPLDAPPPRDAAWERACERGGFRPVLRWYVLERKEPKR